MLQVNTNQKQIKQQVKKAKRDPIIINLTKLAQNITKAELKNNMKYNQIKNLNPDFQYKLYKPVIPAFQARQQLSLAEDIMMRQIDKLMDQEEKLNIQLDRNMIKYNQQQRKIQKQIILNMDHYTFLRKLWKKDQNVLASDTKIDKLIHNVGAIKGHIFNLIKRQTQKSQSPPQIHELVISSPQYCHLLKKYEQLKQQTEIKLAQERYDNTNNSSQTSIESQDTRKQNQYLQAQLSKLKLQLINKNNQIERLKLNANRKRQWRYSYNQAVQEKVGQEGQENNMQRLLNYTVRSHQGSYLINIRQLNKNQCKQYSNNQIKQKIQDTIDFESRQSLDSIINFLKGHQSRRISRGNFTSAQKKQFATRPQKQHETGSKKYTVQQIARPKFISNRQITISKTNENIQIQ